MSSLIDKMSVSISAGPGGLIALGLSISDLALLVDQGKKFGNFLRVKQNNDDLFDTLRETPEAIIKRRGLVEAAEMEKRWPVVNFVHRGKKVSGKIRPEAEDEPQRRRKKSKETEATTSADAFTWVMAPIVSALDVCLPSHILQELLIRIFRSALDGDEDTTEALRVNLRVNIESWRSFGCARNIALSTQKCMRKALKPFLPAAGEAIAIPQLNKAELQDMEQFLVWLLSADEQQYRVLSVITFAAAEALRAAKLDICTNGKPLHEGQPCVHYQAEGSILDQNVPRGLSSRALQLSWPRSAPESMIDALRVDSDLGNHMGELWSLGSKAGSSIAMVGEAFQDSQEVFYSLPAPARMKKKFAPEVGLLAKQGFPVDSQEIYEGLRQLLSRDPDEKSPDQKKLEWLHSHVAENYLMRNESVREVTERGKHADLLLKYQALMFGFYYELLDRLIFWEEVENEAFFHGIWGPGSTTFLAMCTQFGSCLRRDGKVSRAHVLYMLSSMFNGRRKLFDASSSIPRLVGILGTISVLAMPLMRTTDLPEEIWKIAIVDLPLVDLVAGNSDGELLAGNGGGLDSVPANMDRKSAALVKPQAPTETWTVHPSMCMLFESEEQGGMVMVARCGERLVGWFNPLAADITFLSNAYVCESPNEADCSDEGVTAFEMRDEDWKRGQLKRPVLDSPGSDLGIVHSHGSPALRYAAVGFYAGNGEEVAIARTVKEFTTAYERVKGQDQGIVIA